jgi:hypothetical protein
MLDNQQLSLRNGNGGALTAKTFFQCNISLVLERLSLRAINIAHQNRICGVVADFDGWRSRDSDIP